MFIDSHCHLHFMEDKESVLENSIQELEHILCVGTTLEEYDELKELSIKYPQVSISLGLHPHNDPEIEPTEHDYLTYLQDPQIIAVGETGLDYSNLQGSYDLQHARFRRQILVAISINKPLIVHTRDAEKDTVNILREENAGQVGGVFHCFTGDRAFASQVLDLGFYISLSGIVTFKKAEQLQEVAKWLPLDKMLVETDAPWLAPVPFRGKTNKPEYVKYIVEHIAKLRNMDIEDLALQLRDNYWRLFKRKSF